MHFSICSSFLQLNRINSHSCSVSQYYFFVSLVRLSTVNCCVSFSLCGPGPDVLSTAVTDLQLIHSSRTIHLITYCCCYHNTVTHHETTLVLLFILYFRRPTKRHARVDVPPSKVRFKIHGIEPSQTHTLACSEWTPPALPLFGFRDAGGTLLILSRSRVSVSLVYPLVSLCT